LPIPSDCYPSHVPIAAPTHHTYYCPAVQPELHVLARVTPHAHCTSHLSACTCLVPHAFYAPVVTGGAYVPPHSIRRSTRGSHYTHLLFHCRLCYFVRWCIRFIPGCCLLCRFPTPLQFIYEFHLFLTCYIICLHSHLHCAFPHLIFGYYSIVDCLW